MDILVYAAAVSFMRIASLLPVGAALAVGRLVGRALFSIVRIRRRVVLANLLHVMGDALSAEERTALARDCYRHFGMTAVEVARMSVLGLPASGLRYAVEPAFAAALVDAHARREGMVVGVPHLGNFDLAAAASITLGIELQVVMKPAHSERMNRLIVASRAKSGMSLHFTTEHIFDRLKELVREGRIVAALPDQNARRRGVKVDFLGKPANLFKGPARLHLETGAPLFVGAAIRSREDPARHEVIGCKVETPPPSGDRERDIAAVTQAMADALSSLVRRAPEQYFWFHRLWGQAAIDSAFETRG